MATAIPLPQTNEDELGGAEVEQQPADPKPPSFGENNRHLPEELKRVLTAIVRKFQQEELYDRRIEDLADRAMRFYDDGIQHFYANYATGAYQIGAAGASINIGNGDIECSDYLGSYNIFRARRRTIDSVLTQNPPGVDFEPTRPDRTEDIEASETAEGYRHLFDQMNDVSDIQQSITRMFELSGRCVCRTYTETNREKWGLNDDGKPRKMETARIYGTLESTVPILCKSQDDAIYCFTYDDPHILRAKRQNPWLKDETGEWKISAGQAAPGESEWKRYARLGIRQARKGSTLLSSAVAHLITEMHAWLRPDAFESEGCSEIYTGPRGWDEETETFDQSPLLDEEGHPQKISDVFLKMFPEGVRIKYLGDCLSEAVAESMDDAIDIVMSEKRDSLTGGALMEPMKIIQDGFNDFKNAEREFYEKGWPVTWFKGDQEEYDAFMDQQSRPGQMALLKNAGPPDVPVENFFYKEPEMTAPQSFVECMEEYRTALSQDVTGASPALEGVSGPKEETASQRAQDKAQSVGILGPTWSRVQKIFSGIYKKAAILASSNPDHAKEIAVTRNDGQKTTIVLEKLKKGSFHCKPDTDSGFPDSTAAQRANLDSTLPQIMPTPIGAEILSSPDNWEEMFRIKGMSNFTVVPAEAFRKQLREITLLTVQQPVPNTKAVEQYNQAHAAQALEAMANGIPEPPYAPPPLEIPSIPAKKRDFHQWELAKCREWLSSEDCYRLEVQGSLKDESGASNPSPAPGYSDNPYVRNVELHADMHEMFLQQQAPPPSLPAPPQKSGINPQASQASPQVQAAAQPPGAPGQATL